MADAPGAGAAAADGVLRVEVCLALPQRTLRVPLVLPAGSTVRDALLRARPALHEPAALDEPVGPDRLAGFLDELIGRDEPAAPRRVAGAGALAAGVFGRLRPPGWLLREGDRVEIYRPLVVDPKLARRRRAERARRGDPGKPARASGAAGERTR